MNKLLYLFILSFFQCSVLFSQDTRWVRTVQGIGYDDCRDLYTDPSGNVYITGQIEYTSSLNGYNLSSAGVHDILVAKYDSSGSLLWAKHAGGTSGDVGYSVAADAAGNTYVVGEFESTADFSGISKHAQGSNNIFIAKYDALGNIVWVNSIGTNSGSTKGYAVACDPQGNVYACGTTGARAIYDGSTLFSSRGSEDIIVIKFDTDGDYQWFKQIGGSDSDEGFGLYVDGPYLYVTGSFEGTAKFTNSFSLHSDGSKDFFLAQYDSTGAFLWAKNGGGSGDDIGWDVTVNINGDIVCTGEFRSTGTFGTNSIHSNGINDIFITAYDVNGDNLWAISAGGSNLDFGNKISHDDFGNLFITGTFTDSAVFDQTGIASIGDEDVFIASYDSIGNFRYAKGFGGPGHDRGQGIGADRYGNVYACGEYWTYINFDSIFIQGSLLYDGYITRFGNYPVCSVTGTLTHNISCFNSCDGEIIVTPSGLAPFQYYWPLTPQQTTNSITGLCAGNYLVNVTDAYGCVTSTTVSVPQQPAIILVNYNVINTSCIGCSDGGININITGGVGLLNYLWTDGSTSEDRINLTAGTYGVCITDANGCSFCDSFVVLNSPAGINYIYNNSLVEIYPNPADKQTEIHFDKSIAIKNYQLNLYSQLGQKIKAIPLISNDIILPLSELSPGIYLLKLFEINNGDVINLKSLIVNR